MPTFTGGLVGYFSYDYIKYSEPKLELKDKEQQDFRDLDLMLFNDVIAFDHYRQKVLLIKPQTYMNLSGESIHELVDYFKVDPKEELLVIYDDISLNPGQIRIRKKGSAGGHNGIKNIIAQLGTDTFQRIKVGVGEKPKGYDLASYVLGHFSWRGSGTYGRGI